MSLQIYIIQLVTDELFSRVSIFFTFSNVSKFPVIKFSSQIQILNNPRPKSNSIVGWIEKSVYQ